jgi:acyl-CoA synthetase (AMP-forming)/AMP-acid ligase II
VPSLFSVTSHELAQQVLTDNVRFSSAGYATTIGQVMGRTILQMDPPEHLRHRALAAKAFRARVLDQWSGTIIGATVSELIDAFAGDGHADLIPQLTFPFPVRVIARILGLPESDWPRFLRLSTELIAVMRNWDRAVAAGRELRGYFAEIIADRRRHTREDLVNQLIEAEVGGRRLSDDEIYPFLLLLLPAGAETTYRSSSNLLFGQDGQTMGEVVMRGNNVMSGYFHDQAATRKAFSGGWFHSGDLAVWHPDGTIELRDRGKDIISGGENISRIEVEQTIAAHPAVLECTVIGIPPLHWGERPKAFVTLNEGAAAAPHALP